ncbi:MAG: radical SAM protein [Candidatus Zixiibacteriota bacterium]|nr:MAG: radical SAM protein [candidate division Zixibacteria bacterium]
MKAVGSLRLARHALAVYRGRLTRRPPSRWLTLTYSVTSHCQSRCQTCRIGELHQKGAFKDKPDLTLEEVEKIFRSLGPVYFFNVSGGEPFLRSDLPRIVDLAAEHLRPALVHIPTNALAPSRIEALCREILTLNRKRGRRLPLTVKPSIDGVGPVHDRIRGVPGNFQKLEETIVRLKLVEEEFPEFQLELGTIISRQNLPHLKEIENYVHSLGVKSYRNEIAERRSEFFNQDDDITPGPEEYRKVLQRFVQRRVSAGKKGATPIGLTETLRRVYYALAVDIMTQRRQVIPCYAGISNLHLNFDGDLWPCCVLAYDHSLGNVRRHGYNVREVLSTPQAQEVLTYIRQGRCHCPLANQWYSNIVLHPPTLARVLLKHLAQGRS